MRLAISPDTPRTPELMACIRRETILEAVGRLRYEEHEFFQIAFGEKSYVDLPVEDQEQLQILGITPAEYARWEAAYTNWKATQRLAA